MSETVLYIISILLSFFCGLLLGILICNRRERGLGDASSRISESIRECDKLTTEINDTASEAKQLDRDIQESAESIERVSAIFNKYGKAAESSENVE